jgi:hypothetical protein
MEPPVARRKDLARLGSSFDASIVVPAGDGKLTLKGIRPFFDGHHLRKPRLPPLLIYSSLAVSPRENAALQAAVPPVNIRE